MAATAIFPSNPSPGPKKWSTSRCTTIPTACARNSPASKTNLSSSWATNQASSPLLLRTAARAVTVSRTYRPYERQGAGGDIDAVHRDLVRGGVGYIGELSGRMDRYRGRRHPGSYHSCGRQGSGGAVDGVH